MIPLLYFDHNATTPVAPEVAAAFTGALGEVFGNASSVHRTGQKAKQQLESARAGMAKNLGCTPAELVFTSGGTEANNLALLGLVRNLPFSRKHVVTTAVEHPSVLEPMRQLAREGVEVTFAEPDNIEREIRPETVLVSLMHANNETGVVYPIEQLGALVRARRAAGQQIFFHSDGVQALAKLPLAVEEAGVDLYSMSAHKIYGPKGAGALFVRRDTPVSGVQFGGRHERGRRAGTENVPAAVAFARALELASEYNTRELAHLRDRFEQQVLGSLDEVEVNGAAAERLPNTSNLLFRGISGEALLIALDAAGFAVSTGSACSSGSIEPSHVLLAMGLSAAETRSSVRFSFGRTNSLAEVDRLAEAVIAHVQRMRRAKAGRIQLARA